MLFFYNLLIEIAISRIHMTIWSVFGELYLLKKLNALIYYIWTHDDLECFWGIIHVYVKFGMKRLYSGK